MHWPSEAGAHHGSVGVVGAHHSSGYHHPYWGLGYVSPYGYGGWNGGWYGWDYDGGGIVDIYRGQGAFLEGAGDYLLQAARAEAIEAETLGSINQYVYLSNREACYRANLRRLYHHQKLVKFQRANDERLVFHPTEHDIATGDALNALVAVVRNHIQPAGAPPLCLNAVIPPARLRDMVFRVPSSGVRMNVHQLLTRDNWPVALRDKVYAAERDAFHTAIDEVINESRNAGLTPSTLDRLTEAVNRLSDKVETSVPSDFIARNEARSHLTTLTALAKMLRQSNAGELLADLKSNHVRTVGALIRFMEKHNLRFGAASTPGERQNLSGFLRNPRGCT